MIRLSTIMIFVLLLCIPTWSPKAASGTGRIEGAVVDKETGKPLPFANVIVRNSPAGAATDVKGRYFIPRIGVGEYTMVASMMGYGESARQVQVKAGETLIVNFELSESVIAMSEVVVTGTRTPRYIKEVPVRTEVVTRKKIEDKSASNLYEALEGEPGVRVEQACQACNFSTVRLQGLGPDHTQMLIDGQPVYTGLSSVYGLQQIGTSGVERMEIVKGAGSALYGSHAVAGAINMISTMPGPTPRFNVLLQYGTCGTGRLELGASSRIDRVGFVIFGQRATASAIDQTGDGLTSREVRQPDGVSDRVMTESTNLGFNVTIDSLVSGDRLTVRGRSVRELRRGGVMDGDLFTNPFTPGTERIITNRYVVDATYEKVFGNGSDISITAAYAWHERDATNDTFVNDYESANGDLPPIDILRPYVAKEDVYTTNLDYGYLFGRHRLLTGLQYTHNRLEESGMYVVVEEDDPAFGTPFASRSNKHAHDFGVYVQDEYVHDEKLEIVTGVRMDLHRSQDNFFGSGNAAPEEAEPVEYDENSINPRLAVRYRVRPDLYLRCSFGTGFRVPYGFSEDLHLCSGSPRIWKGPGLLPESSRSVTVSADWTGGSTHLGVSFYRTILNDKIGIVEAGADAASRGYTYEWKNIDNAFVQGLEIYAGWQPLLIIDIDASLNINSGEYDGARGDWAGTAYESDSRYVSRFPQYTAGLDFTVTKNGWGLVGGAYLTGPMYVDYYADGEGPTKIKKTDPFCILNAKVSRRIFDRLNLYVGGKNLTDYIQPEKHIDDAAFMYAPVYGRMLYMGIGI